MYPEVHTEPEVCLTMAVDQNGRRYGIEYTSYDPFTPHNSLTQATRICEKLV